MKTLLRHLLVVATAALLAFLISPYITRYGNSLNAFSENSPVDGVGSVAALAVGLTWMIFTIALRRPRTQQWLILGFLSPVLFVPLFYLLTAWLAGYGSNSYGFESPSKIGLIVAGMLSWIFVPLGLLIGLSSAAVTWLVESKIQIKSSAEQPPIDPAGV